MTFGKKREACVEFLNHTCVNAEQPGANERGERLAGFGQQGHHPEEQRRGGLLAPVHHKVLVHQVGDDQFQQLARPLCEHPVTRREGERSGQETPAVTYQWFEMFSAQLISLIMLVFVSVSMV